MFSFKQPLHDRVQDIFFLCRGQWFCFLCCLLHLPLPLAIWEALTLSLERAVLGWYWLVHALPFPWLCGPLPVPSWELGCSWGGGGPLWPSDLRGSDRQGESRRALCSEPESLLCLWLPKCRLGNATYYPSLEDHSNLQALE